MLENARRLRNRALDEYKIAVYFDRIRSKRDYLISRINEQKGDMLRQRIQRENPEWVADRVEEEVQRQIRQEAENIFNSEREVINREIIGIIAYDVLAREEQLAQQELNIRIEEGQRNAGFWGRLWNRYRGLSMARRATVGAVVAGVGAGALAAASGVGFAAIGIGTAYAARRFFGGAVIGGGLKNIGDRIIGRRERKQLDEATAAQVNRIREEIANLISNPEKEPKSYEGYIEVARKLDQRLAAVLGERENIRAKNDKSRRRWTLISVLIGGVAANSDNIYHAFFGSSKPGVQEAISGSGTGKAGGADVGGVRIFKPPESVPVKPQIITEPPPEIGTQLPNVPEVIKQLNQEALRNAGIPAWVGRDGFWGAANWLKEHLGLSQEEFATAWSNSKVIDPISGNELPLPQAHWVRALKPNEHLGLTYDPVNKVFKAVLGPKVEVGDATRLIEAWRKTTGGDPPFRVIWSMLRGGSKI